MRSLGSCVRSVENISPAAERSSGFEDSNNDFPAARKSAVDGFDFRLQYEAAFPNSVFMGAFRPCSLYKDTSSATSPGAKRTS